MSIREDNTNMAKLYVVFHGLISLVEQQTTYRALLLDMPGHVVAAGHWLAELPIPRGAKLKLRGVKKNGTATLAGNKNAILKNAQIDNGKLREYLYAELELPKPSNTFSFHTTDIAKALLPGSSALLTSTKVSGTRVFEYELELGKSGTLKATNPNFGFSFQAQQRANFPVVHILNEPATNVADKHNIDEFNHSAEVLGGKRRFMDKAVKLALSPTGDIAANGLTGMIQFEELFPLAMREQVVRAVLLKAGTPESGNKLCVPVDGGL